MGQGRSMQVRRQPINNDEKKKDIYFKKAILEVRPISEENNGFGQRINKKY
jgi:hypothetical protein